MNDRMLANSISRRAVIGSLLAGASGLQGCAEVKDLYGFRLDVRLHLPNRHIDVHAVRRQAEVRYYDWVPTANRSYSPVSGQAVPVDIDGRTLFITRTGFQQWSDKNHRFSYYGDGERVIGSTWTPEIIYRDRRLLFPPDWGSSGEIIDIQPHEMPALAVFDDTKRPETIRIIPPNNLGDEFPGLRLGRCTVRPSAEKTSKTDVRERLPWLNEQNRSLPDLGDHVYPDEDMFG
ncbi:hypothetical protein [Brevundimonas sp. SL130]|uniref:hypothetical protein n=1 Tax=Brevundimonas sp. SL130 TaxID=2995143 RepID=UPI00226D30EB|nr:hypothetical protein [Brevundimonas sp. SL130]WAC60290.1 hypothetical protein OU998_02240 [Brevundimonas sp. SL130]